MNKISDTNKKSVVKIFSTAAASFILACGSSPRVFAAETTSSSNNSSAASAIATIMDLQSQSNQDSCKDLQLKFETATNKLKEACQKGGYGSDCSMKSLECTEASSEDSFDTLGTFATVLGLPANASKEQINGKCPAMSGKDYYAEKDRINKELKDLQKELAELNDDKADIQDKYSKETQDIQEKLAKAQEDYKKQESDLDQEERDKIADFNKSQNEANEGMRKLGDKLLELKGQVIQLNRDKARSLNLMSESAGKRKCVAELAKMRKEYESLYSGGSSSSGNHIAKAKSKKQDLIDFYNACMSDFNQQRIELNEKTRQKQEALDKQIRDTQSSLDEVQNSLNLASNQLAEIKEDIKKKKSNALQSVIDLGTRSQQQMQSAYNKLQENLKSISVKSMSLQQALNRANQEILDLGGAPKKGSELSRDAVASEIQAQSEILMSIANSTSLDDPKCRGLKSQLPSTIKRVKGTK